MSEPQPHAVLEPVLVRGPTGASNQCIEFHCPCGWHSDALRPEAKGTLTTICTELRQHLLASHHQ
jgi:hypothetical protein